jgi:hypothetical protein
MGVERAAAGAEPKAAFDPSIAAAFALVVGVAFAVSIYAAFAWRSLYADGFLYFTEVIVSRSFALTEPARLTVHILQQFPTVLALHLGVAHLETLVVIYGLSLQTLPLVLTVACYPVLPREQKPLFLFPLAHYLFGTMAAAFVPVVEGPVAAAYFWLLLFLVLFGQGRRVVITVVCLAPPALYLHETTVLLMPILSVAAAVRARAEASRPMRALFWLLAGWFMVIAIVQAGFIIHPRSAERRLDVLMTARALFGIGNLNGANVPALMSIAAVAAAAAIYRLRARGRASWWVVLTFAAFSAALLVATLVRGESGRLFAPGLQFAGRNLAVVVSAPLAVLLLACLRRGAGRSLWLAPPITAVVLILAVGQATWHAIGIHYWSQFTQDFRALLASHQGYVHWREALADLSPAQATRLQRLDWSWTNPLMSIVLSPGGRVGTVIGPLNERGWAPFDPMQPDQLPRAPQFDYAAYLRALSGAAPPCVSLPQPEGDGPCRKS